MRRRMLSMALMLLLWLIGKRLVIDPILQQVVLVFYDVSASLAAISLPKGLR